MRTGETEKEEVEQRREEEGKREWREKERAASWR